MKNFFQILLGCALLTSSVALAQINTPVVNDGRLPSPVTPTNIYRGVFQDPAGNPLSVGTATAVGTVTAESLTNEVLLSESYPRNAQPRPAVWWDSFGPLGTALTTANLLAYVTNVATYGLGYAPIAFEVDDGWQRVMNVNGILQDDTNVVWVRAVSDACHALGMRFFLYFQIEGASDGGGLGLLSGSAQPASFGVNNNVSAIVNIEGNIRNMITNYNVDGLVFLPYRGASSPDLQWAQVVRVLNVVQAAGRPIYTIWYGGNSGNVSRSLRFINSWKPGTGYAFADGTTSYRDLISMVDLGLAASQTIGVGHSIVWSGMGTFDFAPTSGPGWTGILASYAVQALLGTEINLGTHLGNGTGVGVETTQQVMTNSDFWSVQQDALVIPARSFNTTATNQMLVKPLANGGVAVGLLNRTTNTVMTMTFNASAIGLPTNSLFNIVNIWARTTSQMSNDTFSAVILSNSCGFYKVTPVGNLPTVMTNQVAVTPTNQFSTSGSTFVSSATAVVTLTPGTWIVEAQADIANLVNDTTNGSASRILFSTQVDVSGWGVGISQTTAGLSTGNRAWPHQWTVTSGQAGSGSTANWSGYQRNLCVVTNNMTATLQFATWVATVNAVTNLAGSYISATKIR